MARYSEQFIQQVAQATDIVDLMGNYVALKKRGREFIGLCLFHEDHRPSMNVSPTKQIFKCFACGAGGGVFQFLMLFEKLSFPEAVRELAERAGIPLPQTDRPGPAEGPGLNKAELVKATTFGAQFYRSALHSPSGQAALDYARSRGLSEESIRRFGLGYAPEGWDALLAAAEKKGFTRSQLLAAGLVQRSEESGRCYDRFRNRLIFPIIDPQGRVVAFGGRALAAEERAKYLNSPETVLFDKSSQLYGLNWSRGPISQSGQAIVVEGYLDALMPLQAGIENVVATLGTALTDRHVRLLSRYAREVVLVFDADAAGAAAARRALEMFVLQKVNVRVATIPAGKDPCDYCLAEGPEALRNLVSTAPDALEYAWRGVEGQYRSEGRSLADRREGLEDFLQLVASCSAYGAVDEIRRGQLVQHIGHMLNIPAADLHQELRRVGRRLGRPASKSPSGVQGVSGSLAERQVIEVLLAQAELQVAAWEKLEWNDFQDRNLRRIAEQIWARADAGGASLEQLLAGEELADLGPLLTDLARAGERRGNYEQTLAGAVEYLLCRQSARQMQELKAAGLKDEHALRELNQQLRQADPRGYPKIS